MKIAVEDIAVEKLKPYPNNPRVNDHAVAADQGWENYLTQIFAEQFGLTPEQHKHLQTLETDAEIDAFLAEHSTVDVFRKNTR